MRTESMAQKLSKKPLSEGYELWDKGFFLAAMRLFIFKAENSPPFQLGPCLEGVAQLLARMEEGEDAKENFEFAAERYELIQQGVLAQVMKIKGVEATKGQEAALELITELVLKHDADRKAAELTDAKLKPNLARAYHYRAELLLAAGKATEALADAQLAVSIGWDRVFLAHFVCAQALAESGNDAAAIGAFQATIAANANFVPAYEELSQLMQKEGQKDEALRLLTAAIALHPKSQLIRSKAFLLSEMGNDTEAIALLDTVIETPPFEETESVVCILGQSTATFYKAKAAILADAEKLAEAKTAAEAALVASPGDAEAEKMVEDITAMLAE